MTHILEKNQSIEKDPEMSQMVELADKDTSIMPFISRKVEEVKSVLKETEVLRHPASAFGLHIYIHTHISLHMHSNLHTRIASTSPHNSVCVVCVCVLNTKTGAEETAR